MAYYESVFIARQDISATQVEGLTETFTKLIGEHGGKVAGTESWGLRALAYKIKKNRKGHYVLLNIDAPSGAIHEMERQMRINEDILRYLTIKVDALEEEPSIMMRNAQRDDRPRRHGGGDRPAHGSKPDDKPVKTEETEAPGTKAPEKKAATDADKPAKKDADKPASESADKPAGESADKPAGESADKPAGEGEDA